MLFGKLFPEAFETKSSIAFAFGPEAGDHLCKGKYLLIGLFSGGGELRHSIAHDAIEQGGIGLAFHHESGQSFVRVEQNKARFGDGEGEVRSALSHVRVERVAVGFCGDEQNGTTGTYGRGDELSKLLKEEQIVAVKLNDMGMGAGRVPEGIGHLRIWAR